MYDYDYTALQNETEETAPKNPVKTRWQIIAAIGGVALLLVGLCWFMFAGIKIIFPDYISGVNVIQADGKLIYTDGHSIFYKGKIDGESKLIVKAENNTALLSNGRTLYYINNGDICSVDFDGKNQTTVCHDDHAVSLVHRYHDLLYFMTENTDKEGYALCSFDVKKGETVKIDSVVASWPAPYVCHDMLYYYIDEEMSDVWAFDFKSKETHEIIKNANLYGDARFGEEPLLVTYDASTYSNTAVYEIKNGKAEQLCALPENSVITYLSKSSDELVLYNNDSQKNLLFNLKTGESRELSGMDGALQAVYDHRHPEQVYVLSCKADGTGYSVGDISLLKDGKLQPCTMEPPLADDTVFTVKATVIDGFLLDNDYTAHKITVKADE